MIPKISIAIITYNQENLIGRALDSVLKQKEYVYEIIISDDCSTDNNWQVIMDYYHKYPDIIKPYRQECNLGINRNLEFIWTIPTGDIIIELSGDDALSNNLLKSVIYFINDKKIDFYNEKFVIYADYESITPKGKRKRFSNHLILKGYDPISLKIRQHICNRTTIVSRLVYKNFKLLRPDLGMFADELIDIQTQIYSENNYYIPIVGSIYYAGIGVSAHCDLYDNYSTRIEANKEFEKIFNLSSKDKFYLKYKSTELEFRINPTISKFFLIWNYYFKSIYIKKEYKIIWILRRMCSLLIRLLSH